MNTGARSLSGGVSDTQSAHLRITGALGTYQGRTFAALINLNAENTYRVVIRARKR